MITRFARHLSAVIFLVITSSLFVTSASAASDQQIVQLRASDGRSVPALVTYPDGGPDTQSPVAIIHHGGPGGHPLRALSAARWAANNFAENGYITISILSRISRDVIDQPFGSGIADIKGAVDWASQLSSGPIVLVGHSSGSVSLAYYQATMQDPRVKAIIHYAPTFPGRRWMPVNMGQPRYDEVVTRLRKLVAKGKGDEPIYEDHKLAPPAPQNITYGYLMSARTWLSWWGPDSKQNNVALFPKIRVPMLLVSGDADIFVNRAYHEELRKAAVASPRIDAIMMEGGVGHEFTGAEEKASKLALDWLSEIGITPTPRVTTRIVDLKIGFESRPGIIYEPTILKARKPVAVMLMPDFAEDIMLSPLDAIGPRLARAGYTVLIPQDRGGGWAFYRAVANDVSIDQKAWLSYLSAQGQPNVAIVAHGWAGAMVPSLLSDAPSLLGVALIQPPAAPAQFAKDALGAEAYAKALADAEAAVKSGDGGKTMIVVPYRKSTPRKWINHMASGFLSFWGPAAPPAPVPTLQAARMPLLLFDTARPFDRPDTLATDIANWLDELLKKQKGK